MLPNKAAKQRRSQEDRSEEARGKAIDAAIQLLVSGGFAAASTPAIAVKAGMSRGRLTHQFPTKDALLVAICEHLTDVFVETFTLDLREGATIEQQVETIVREAARIYLSDDYLALLHILFGASGQPELASGLAKHSDAIAEELPRVFRQAFDGLHVAPDRLALAFRMIVNVLRGMAIGRFLGRENSLQEAELSQLIRDVTRMIHDTGPTGAAT